MITSHLVLAAATQSWQEILVGFAPIAVFLIALYMILRRMQSKSPLAQLQRKYLEQQLEFMTRVEGLLERIAKALERRE